MRRLAALALTLLLASPATAVWVAGTITETVPLTTETPYTQTFQLAGVLTGIDTSGCRNPLLLSFDASIVDASDDARVRWFSCDDWQTTPPAISCQEIPIESPATGATLHQYTDFAFNNARAALVPIAEEPTAGGDTARLTLKCDTVEPEGVLTTASGAAADITLDPIAGFAATDVQAGIEELYTEKPDTTDLTQVTSGEADPGVCAATAGCIYMKVSAAGDLLRAAFAINGEQITGLWDLVAGYLFPSNPNACVAIGDEASAPDKDIVLCPNAQAEFTHGTYTPPATVREKSATWKTTGYDPAQSAERMPYPSGATQVAAVNLALSGEPTNEDYPIRALKWTIRVSEAVGVSDADDTVTFGFYCCPQTAANFAACTSFETGLLQIDTGHLPPQEASGAFGAEDTSAAGTCDYLVFGTVSGADANNSIASLKFGAVVEYEN